jgi:hypothetical protein
MLPTGRFCRFEAASPSGEGHIWRGFRTVNGFFQETCKGTEFRAFAGVFGRPDAKNQAIWHRTVILSLPRSSRIE